MKHDQTAPFRESVLKNQQALVSNLADEYDFIVCGTGSSGSVVAGRLASDLKIRVLVLEAGGSDESVLVMDPVKVNAAYLEDPADLKSLAAGLKTARAIGNAPALAGFRGQESLPGTLSGSDLVEFFRNDLTTFWHQSCTAKMGRDEMSVVDSKLKVYGLHRLRVADASILPRVTTGNTMAPCVVIGERAAMLLGAAE